ncbi:MAG: LysR family transcriptional regulator [Oscillospiraceae bacterium]|nr:LysR family transcriptional regulator [Oscillospiraceae bacterium]
MNLSQIEVIVEIAKAGSISKAAQNLYISQPGVSKILQKFEEEVGAQIFERVSTGVRLTPVGRKFVKSAMDVIEQAGQLERMFKQNDRAALTMELRLASVSYQFIQCMLEDLCRKYSQNPLQIHYVECGLDEEVDRLTRGDIEIAVNIFWKDHLRRSMKKLLAKGVEYHRVGSAVPYIGVSRDSKKYPPDIKELDFSRLTDMPLVIISPFVLLGASSISGWDFMHSAFKMENLDGVCQEIEVNNTGTMQELLCRVDGFSLILLNPGIYSRYGFSERIRLIPLPGADRQFELGWLQRANTVRQPLADEFINMLRENASDD